MTCKKLFDVNYPRGDDKMVTGEVLPHHWRAVYDPLGREYRVSPGGSTPQLVTTMLADIDVIWSGAYA